MAVGKERQSFKSKLGAPMLAWLAWTTIYDAFCEPASKSGLDQQSQKPATVGGLSRQRQKSLAALLRLAVACCKQGRRQHSRHQAKQPNKFSWCAERQNPQGPHPNQNLGKQATPKPMQQLPKEPCRLQLKVPLMPGPTMDGISLL